MADLRDETVHLIISQVPKDILALFQACTLNYHKRLCEWFNISLSDRVSVGMMTIVYDFSPDQFDLNNPIFRRQLGRDAANYLSKLQVEVKQEFENLGKPAEFSIDISYKLALVKKVGEAEFSAKPTVKRLYKHDTIQNECWRTAQNKSLHQPEQLMPEYRTYITSNPNILFGKPAIKDTRIAVEHILDELAGGTTIDELLEAYPRLTREAIFVALAFAADTLRSEVIYPLD